MVSRLIVGLVTLGGATLASAAPTPVVLHGPEDPLCQAAMLEALRHRGVPVRVTPPGPAANVPVAPFPEVERARLALKEGKEAYYAARSGKGVRLLGRALKSEQALAEAGAYTSLASLHLWLGVNLAKLGKVEAARRAFVRASDLGAPPLDPTLFPPKVLFVQSRALEAARARSEVPLTVDVKPNHARLLLDGRPIPRRGRVAPGARWLRVSAVGFESATRRIEVGARALRLELTLRRAPPQRVWQQLAAVRGEGVSTAAAAAALAHLSGVNEALAYRCKEGSPRKLVAARVSVDGDVVSQVSREGEDDAALAREVVLRLWPERRTPFYKRAWFWVAAGALVAGSTTALVIGLSSGGTTRYDVVP